MSTAETPEKPAARLMRQNYQAKIGERTLMAGMMAKGRALAMWNARKTINGTLGRIDPEDPMPTDDDMQIRVGDEVHHHHEAQQAGPTQQPASGISKLALTAALAMGTGGIGIGAAIPFVLDVLNPPPPAPPPVTAPVDTDTRNTFTLS